MTRLMGKRVLITGATGFVGSRLAARLAREEGARVTATGRNLQAIRHLQEDGVALRRAHLLDFGALRRLAADQDVVFHLAAWLGPRHGPPDHAWALNVYATEKLVHFAAASGVARLVLVSSIAAYGAPDRPVMDETRPLALRQRSLYGRTKAQAERRATQAAAKFGLPLVVARPGIVYGPGSYGWSRRMVRLVQKGLPVIFGAGAGHAHPVFVDNLIDGLLLTASCPAAAGRAFNFVDRPVTWREWFNYFGAMCGRPPRAIPMWLARIALVIAERLPLGLSIDRGLLGHVTNRSIYPTDNARQHLGYRPRVDLAQGMALTEAWLRREKYL